MWLTHHHDHHETIWHVPKGFDKFSLKEKKIIETACLCDLSAAEVNFVPVFKRLQFLLKRVSHRGRRKEGEEEEEEEWKEGE